jgi:hypothetical protein
MRRALLIFCVFLSYTSFGQLSQNRKALELLSKAKEPVYVYKSKESIRWVTDKDYPNCKQELIAYDGKLIVTIMGTGRVYQWQPDSAGIVFKRIDKTLYAGANLHSLYFVHNSQLYNLGGYGFWQVNGILKIFDTSVREWEKVNTQTIQPMTTHPENSFVYHDPKQEKIFFIKLFQLSVDNPNHHHDLDHQVFRDNVYQLDLKTLKWDTLGDFYHGNKGKDYWPRFIKTPVGALNNFTLVDLQHNRQGLVNRSVMSQLKNFIFDDDVMAFAFYKDDQVFVAQTDNDSVGRISLGEDLVESWTPYYNPATPGRSYSFFAIFALLILALLPVGWFFYKKNKKRRLKLNEQYVPVYQGDFLPNLTEVEQSLLLLLLKGNVNVQEINDVLGLKNKPGDIQKNIRSGVISSINKKFIGFSSGSIPLIQRRRSEEDKRSFVYFIYPDHIKKYNLQQMMADQAS